MRNWACARKGGGGEKSFLVRSVAVETVVIMAAVGGKATAILEPAPVCGEGVATTAASSSGPLFRLDIVPFSAQQGIDACIDVSWLCGCARQHTAAAGMAVTNSTSTAANVVATRFVIDVLTGYTI